MVNNIAKDQLVKDELQPEIEVDMEIGFDELTPTFSKIISFLEPFGPGSPQPVFTTKNIKIVDDVRFTKTDAHIFKISDGISDKVWNAIYYNSKKLEGQIFKGAVCDICYSFDKNFKNGYTKFIIKDIKIH